MSKLIQVGDVIAQIERKSIKNTYIRVKPDGSVVITCPRRTTDRELRYLIEERYHWIMQHRQKVLERQAAQPPEVGEERWIPLWGKRCPLRLEPGTGKAVAVLEGGEVILRGAVDADGQKQAIDVLYRAQLNTHVPRLVEQAVQATGLRPNEWRIRDMHTRWGSCNVDKRRVWLSLNLAKYPPECLYCVIIHELCHLLERGHNARFYGFMDRFYPAWRAADRLLKSGVPAPK